MSDLNKLTLADARDALRRGDVTSLELTEACLSAIDEASALGAFAHKTPDLARARAKAADARIKAGDAPDMCGIPVGIKDLFCTEGVASQAASKILEGFLPQYESTVSGQLRDAGAVMLGKLNMDEFAMGSSTERSAWFATRNPWDGERVPGGSSGGSAAAVAAGIVPVALGSDTGGSLRQPAALCGVSGFRPSQGAVSRHGLVAHASSLDQVGPICAHASDLALVYDVLAGGDEHDMSCWPGTRPSAVQQTSHLDGLRIALPEEFLDDDVDPKLLDLIGSAREQLDAAGAVTKVLRRGRLPRADLSLASYQVLSAAEASSNLARYDGLRYGPREEGADLAATYGATRATRFGAEVRRRVALGTHVLSGPLGETLHARASTARARLTAELLVLFDEFDLIAGPTTPRAAQRLGSLLDDTQEMARCDRLTVPACLAGLPAVTVPCGLLRKGPDKGLPVGLSLMGAPGSDHRVLAAARAFEAVRGAPERNELFGGTA